MPTKNASTAGGRKIRASKPRARKPPAREAAADAPRLTREDWLDAAFGAVVDGGFDQVRVLTLSRTLGVTRGSFYWHFAEQADLVAGLIARWRERQIEIDRALRSPQVPAEPRAALEHVLDAALAHVGSDLEHMRFELALRGLGRRDAAVARTLQEVDAMRMALLQERFARLLGDDRAATHLATLFYLAIVGSHQALSRPAQPAWLKDYLRDVIAEHLIRRQRPRRARSEPRTERPARSRRPGRR